MYFIKPFGLTAGVSGTLLIAPHLSIRIKDQNMASFLFGLDGKFVQRFEEGELVEALCLADIEPQKGINFLQQTGILENVKEDKYRPFSKCVLISDQAAMNSTLIKSLESDGVEVVASCLPEILPPRALQNDTLFIILLEKYSPKYIRDLYRSCEKLSNVGFIQAYYFRSEFKIDGLYIPSLGSPCHFCHFDRWKHREHRSFGSNKNSWYQVVDLLTKHDKYIPPSIQLTDSDRYFSVHLLRRRIQQLAGVPVDRIHLDSFISSISADLISCNVISEPVPHWHSCNCINSRSYL